MTSFRWLPLLAALVLVPTAASSAATAVKSGLHGTVTRGPTQPVCQAESQCTAPVAGAHITFAGRGVTRNVRTDEHGRYSIHLAPGTYTVRVSDAPFGYGPTKATVTRGLQSRLNIAIDSGIR